MKVPKPRKLKSGNWFIQLRLGGESVPVTALTEKECVRQAELIKAEHRNGKREKSLDGSKMTLSEAIDGYIDSKQNTLSPSTIRGYRIIQKHRFKDVMDTPIKDIKNWQQICDKEAALCSSKTLKNAFGLVKAAVKNATGIQIKADEVTMPQIVKSERPFLEPDEIPLFLAAITGTDVELAALLSLHGMRVSEVCALEATNVNFKRRCIKTSGALVLDERNQLVDKDEAKNVTSDREVPILIDRLYDLLLEYEDKHEKLVKLNPNAIYRRINKYCRRSGLTEVGVHGLRHSFASLAFSLGVPEEEAMEIGGWADFETMRKIYTHLAKRDKQESRKKFNAFFSDAYKNANENAN